MYLLLKHGGFSIVILVFAGRKCMFSIFFKETSHLQTPKIGCWRWCPQNFPKIFSHRWWKNTGKVGFFGMLVKLTLTSLSYWFFLFSLEVQVDHWKTIFLGNLKIIQNWGCYYFNSRLDFPPRFWISVFLCFFLHFPTWNPKATHFLRV